MFIDSTFTAIEADAHRRALIAQADHRRLVKLVTAGTRVTRRTTDGKAGAHRR